MKKVVFAVAAIAVTLMFALPSFAADTKAKPVAKVHECTGAITALDAAKGSVTVKNKDDEKTFSITSTTKISGFDKGAMLDSFKVGDKVKVSYTEDAIKLTATKIALVSADKAKTPAAPAPAPAAK